MRFVYSYEGVFVKFMFLTIISSTIIDSGIITVVRPMDRFWTSAIMPTNIGIIIAPIMAKAISEPVTVVEVMFFVTETVSG